ncbi:unnamed protein product, partial [Ectocarpus sp. 12 AP-2014]
MFCRTRHPGIEALQVTREKVKVVAVLSPKGTISCGLGAFWVFWAIRLQRTCAGFGVYEFTLPPPPPPLYVLPCFPFRCPRGRRATDNVTVFSSQKETFRFVFPVPSSVR